MAYAVLRFSYIVLKTYGKLPSPGSVQNEFKEFNMSRYFVKKILSAMGDSDEPVNIIVEESFKKRKERLFKEQQGCCINCGKEKESMVVWGNFLICWGCRNSLTGHTEFDKKGKREKRKKVNNN
jgi:hypothetical protein